MSNKIKFLSLIITISICFINSLYSDTIRNPQYADAENNNGNNSYRYPDFYKGIYLNVYSARNKERLSVFIEKARKTGINTIVMDVQGGSMEGCAVSPEIVSYCIKNGFHPVARVVVFEDGLSKYPVSEELIGKRLNTAEMACKNGFREIQFDYIRFSDIHISKRLSMEEKYNFIEGFLRRAKNQLSKYDAKIAADIFGRIPLNKDDAIGQKMEVFDRVADIICPMAYPSHYTWSNNLMANPYHTVYITSKSAKERSKNAEIVTYIQAFQMKVYKSNMTFDKYIEEQMRAVHNAGVKGYILWNASQKYDVPFHVVGKYYRENREALNPGKMEMYQ